MSTLTDALQDIAGTELSDEQVRDMHDRARADAPPRYQYKHFPRVTRADYGRDYDFEVIPLAGNKCVFQPHSQAAKAWIWDELPDSADGCGTGYIVYGDINQLVKKAEQAGLVDRVMAETNEQDTQA